MVKTAVLFAPGFEEVEGLTIVDILRRAAIDTIMVGVETQEITGAHDITIKTDKLLDDQALIINTSSGLIVLSGCGHRGIINTLYHAQQLTGVKPIFAVMGGFHLTGATEEQLWLTIAALRELNVQRVGVSHCTGLTAAAIIAQELGDRVFFNNAGITINLP